MYYVVWVTIWAFTYPYSTVKAIKTFDFSGNSVSETNEILAVRFQYFLTAIELVQKTLDLYKF